MRSNHQPTKKILALALLALGVAAAAPASARAQKAEASLVREASSSSVARADAVKDSNDANRVSADGPKAGANEPTAKADEPKPAASESKAEPRPRWGSTLPPQSPQSPATPPTAATPGVPQAPTQPGQQPPAQTPTGTTQPQQQPPASTPAQDTTPQPPVQTTQPPSNIQSQPTVAPQSPSQSPQPTNVTPGGQVPAPQGPPTPGRESVPAPGSTQLTVPSVAPGFRADEGPFPALERVGVQMSEQRALTLREAIEMALANNKDIEVARQNVRAAEFDMQGARGVYDPRLSTFSYYDKTETPAASFLAGSSTGSVTQSGFFNSTTFQGLTPKGGGSYRVDFTSSRVTTNNSFTSLNPQFPSALTFNYTQPILRGRRFDLQRRNIEIANRNLSLTDAQFRQRAIETITNVQRAYWDLVFSLRNLQIQRDAVRDARTQLEHNKRLVNEGMLAPIDVVAAEAQVSGFEQSVYSALDDVGRAENALKNLIAENRESPFWNVAVVPVDDVEVQPPGVLLPDAMTAALSNRPELKASDVAREINEIEQRFAREQTKTQVDLVASYGLVGLAGSLSADTSNPLTGTLGQLQARINELSAINNLPPLPAPTQQQFPEALVGGYPQSLLNLAANRYNNFRVGVNINLPFRNRTAQAQLGRTLVDEERIRVQREQLEQLIQVDVRNALQLVRTAESRLRAAASARSASEQQYESERRKLDAGQSTVFLVLERQTALTTARGNELRAQTELNKAVAELQRATGNSLEATRVEVRVR
ncbi:MAG TPA: TolC family protein [Pyrinomonadaceae bacterium]|nr:TolC family protein [Pyrinomonadaceae bacterium]